MRLLHDNKIDGATLTPSSENANYLAANLKDTRLSRKWRATGDEDESLLIAGSSLALEVFRATTNLVSDPEDLTTGNWTEVDVTASLSDEYYDGKRFSKILLSANLGRIEQPITFTGNAVKSTSVIIKNGNDANVSILIRDHDDGLAVKLNITINWATKTITESTGTAHIVSWLDDNTVEIGLISESVTAANDNRIWYRAPLDEDYFYVTAAQAEDLPYPTPYVNGSRAVTHPDETFEMPSRFTLDMIFKPWFTYDVASSLRFLSWYIDATHLMRINYDQGSDLMRLDWKDGGTIRLLVSAAFDDGTTKTVNQRIRITASIDLTTGTNAGSRFIVIPLEQGAISEDILWSGAIDPHESTFPTLSRGHENDLLQADSQFEYQRIYAGTLVGTVADSDDADALLAEKELILDLTDLKKITASYALIAGHNLSAGARIKLQGNNFNSWNGPPLEEDMTWDSKTIIHSITEVSYPFWRLLIDDPNNADGIIKIGRPYLGTYYQVEKTFNKDFTEEPFNTDVNVYSKSGQLYSRRGYDGKQYNLMFPYWENSVKQAIEKIMATVGKRNPLFLILDEDNIDKLPVLYCHIPDDPSYPHIVNYQWKASLSFREVK